MAAKGINDSKGHSKGFITNSNETADEENAVKPSSDVLSVSVVESCGSLLHFAYAIRH